MTASAPWPPVTAGTYVTISPGRPRYRGKSFIWGRITAKSAARGDTKKAEKAAGDAIALLEKSAGRQRLDDLNQAAKSTQDFLKQMLKGVYQPKEEKTPSESQPPSRH